MARSFIRAKIHRHCYKVYIGGLIVCIFIVILLTQSTTNSESPKRNARIMQSSREGSSFNSKKELHIDTSRKIKQELTLAVFVMSAPAHLENRNVIRQTWASRVPKKTQVYFVLGNGDLTVEDKNSMAREEAKYKDLVILDNFKESYSTLTPKLAETLKWADDSLQADYFMKVDEDTFVRLDQVLSELRTKPKQMMYWGFFDGRAHVKKTGKWAEKGFVLCDRYLPYALGGGYVISSDLVHYIAKNFNMLQFFNSEDVSLGTWLAPLRVNRIHDPHFNTEFKSRGCFNSYIVTHKQSIDDMLKYNRSLHTNGRLCETEYRTRLSYNYNWDVLPTNCCAREDSSIP